MLSARRFSNISSRSETVLPKLHRVREGTDDRYRSQDQVQEQHANHLPRHPLHLHTVDRVHVGQGQRVIEQVVIALHAPGTSAIKLFFCHYQCLPDYAIFQRYLRNLFLKIA